MRHSTADSSVAATATSPQQQALLGGLALVIVAKASLDIRLWTIPPTGVQVTMRAHMIIGCTLVSTCTLYTHFALHVHLAVLIRPCLQGDSHNWTVS